MRWWLLAVAAALSGATGVARAQGVDPLDARLETRDAERFAQLWHDSDGAPDAPALQRNYLDGASDGVAVFTPHRIESAANLAAAIAAEPEIYRDAVERCLPWAAQTSDELRATYLGFHGLLPETELPRVSLVVGANNSGGTAAPGMQVLGLEVICRLSSDEQQFRDIMRRFYAHETVHTWQDIDYDSLGPVASGIANILAEGTADYLAWLVTGRVPDPARDAWARQHEDFVWGEFAKDVAAYHDPSLNDAGRRAIARRWTGNAGHPPEGWPSELGYWVGMRIAEGYVANSGDRHAAIRELLTLDDPMAIVQASGLANRIAPTAR
ncbi:hypothetical protein [Aurantiacibacter spongiae]|uniref:DUF2268 domain-containing protein n=1 Tax=Aurantiacibacter spongiae TaxID=2488860 RepID=A0A3N5CR33_9SPHN|nr:hypothetical protein [Aurantiacibacter spongiae]RPF71077.1 hypothetical protein EG799_05205 [Aurantiacibacter spongiae]